MYELINQFKRLGSEAKDILTGKTIEQEINNELAKHRILTAGAKLEPLIILEALRLQNKLISYALDVDKVDEILKLYAQGKI